MPEPPAPRRRLSLCTSPGARQGIMPVRLPGGAEMKTERSQALFQRAQEVMVGGVNSPVRAFKAVGGDPLFIASGEGAYFTDVDGNRYLDCIGSWGPLLLGHAHPRIQEALRQQI